ncbi:MAG: thymidine kinase [Chitinophagaceae bacterium]
MFIEPQQGFNNKGWIEVICGSMFSGKTEELIRRIKRARIANMKVEIYKPKLDDRYHPENIVSHNENMIRSVAVNNAAEILDYCIDSQVVAIDEAQFFSEEIIDVCNTLALRGVRVIVAGLDMDYAGIPFGKIPELLAIADYITKLHAICVVCGNIANYSYRKTEESKQVILGEKNIYEPRCRICFNK